ncbi:hypothetical protein phytr_9740 [Candidatus Phycorickettsia trachydisci]|uniref:Uncharacterized protein n=1 Tax=Candidatus Phycorickettsia trachydisci TaxID=2115978 RepID=A0A2P1P9E8_9RICK|nr:hypothetical protein [Candidatus Phycorickettsia trachydisci]AVP87902.1 hypothetical protein phytr_9740 [Candidatus Phycorickettsia trachydisci]
MAFFNIWNNISNEVEQAFAAEAENTLANVADTLAGDTLADTAQDVLGTLGGPIMLPANIAENTVEANTVIDRIREFVNFNPRGLIDQGGELFNTLLEEMNNQPTSIKIAAAVAILGACGAIGMGIKSLYYKTSSDAIVEAENHEVSNLDLADSTQKVLAGDFAEAEVALVQ